MENIDTKALLGQIKKIEIRTNRAVDEIFGGAWRSVFRGRGIEFDEVREYADGDDVRDIDWSVTARTGKPFVKKYVEERELSVVLLVDASASQHYGSGGRSKLARSAECAAMLALSAVRNHDKVGLALFTDRIERWISVAGGRKHSLRLVRELLGFRPSSGRTDIANALRELCSIQRRRAIVFLFSDMLGSMTEYGHDLKLAAARHDIVCVRIHDPGEENAPSGAGALFADPETGMVYDLAAGGSMEWFSAESRRQCAGIRRICLEAGVDMVDLSTADDAVRVLVEFFRRRGAGRRRRRI